MVLLLAVQAVLVAGPAGSADPARGPGAYGLCTQAVLSDPGARDGDRAPPLDRVYEATAEELRLEAYAVPARPLRTGDTVRLHLAIVNRSPRAVRLVTSAYLHARVVDARGSTVWVFPAAPSGVPAGTEVAEKSIGCQRVVVADPFVMAVDWDLTDERGRPVPPGEYSVLMSVGTTPKLAEASPIRVTVLRRSSRSRR